MNVLGLRERITAAEAQAANTREQIERTRALVEAGRVARAEQLTLEAQLAQEEVNVTDVRNQHDKQLLVLARTMQLEASEMSQFDIVAPAISDLEVIAPTASEQQVLENVLRTHPAYAQAELQERSAEKSVAIAQAGRIPSLSLNASLGTGYSGGDIRTVGGPIMGAPVAIGTTAGGEVVFAPNISYNTELTPFNDQLDQNLNESIIFTLNIPIFNNMRNRYAVQQARVQHEKVRNNVTSLRNDLQESIQLSPSGRNMAVLRNHEGQTFLETQTVTGQDAHPVVSTDNREYIITWFRWVNDERLLVSIRFAATREATDTIETRLLAVNRDGTEQTANLFKQSAFASMFGRKHFPRFREQLVGTIPGDPRHVLLALDLEHPDAPDVYKVDVYSGERQLVEENPSLKPDASAISQWIADRAGVVRARVGQFRTAVHAIVRLPESSLWRELAGYDLARETGLGRAAALGQRCRCPH